MRGWEGRKRKEKGRGREGVKDEVGPLLTDRRHWTTPNNCNYKLLKIALS